MDISTLFTQAARKWPQALAIKDLRAPWNYPLPSSIRPLMTSRRGWLSWASVQASGLPCWPIPAWTICWPITAAWPTAGSACRWTLAGTGRIAGADQDAGARLLLFGNGHAHVAAALVEQGVVCLPLDAVSVPGMAAAPQRVARARTELASLNYTGGTTGAPRR
jgi:hypothetical protein